MKKILTIFILSGVIISQTLDINALRNMQNRITSSSKNSNIEQEIKLIYPVNDDSIFLSLFESINKMKVILMEFSYIPLYFMGGMND